MVFKEIKKYFFNVLDFLLFSNIFIALCAVAQGLVTYHLLKLDHSYNVLGILFLGTLVIYNFSMLITKPKDPLKSSYRRVRWIFSHYRLMTTITMVAILGLIPLGLFFISVYSLILISVTGVLAFAYALPLFMLNGKPIGLRNLPGVKLFLISLIWSVSSVIFPIIEAEQQHIINVPVHDIFLLAAKRFLFIAAITIPFDIRDFFQDKLFELKTLPVLIGIKKSHWICFSFLLLYLILLLLFNNTWDLNILALTLTILTAAWLIFKSNFKRNEYYYFFFLDGIMILQFLLLKFITVI